MTWGYFELCKSHVSFVPRLHAYSFVALVLTQKEVHFPRVNSCPHLRSYDASPDKVLLSFLSSLLIPRNHLDQGLNLGHHREGVCVSHSVAVGILVSLAVGILCCSCGYTVLPWRENRLFIRILVTQSFTVVYKHLETGFLRRSHRKM